MSLLQSIIAYFIEPALGLYMYVLIAYMIFSWLLAFNVVNLRNPGMASIYRVVSGLVEPVLNPIRRFIPPLGGLDMAFLVLVLGIFWVRGFLLPMIFAAVG